MNDAWTILVRCVGVIGVTLVTYGVVVSATRMAFASFAVAAAVAGAGLAWALLAE